METAPYDHDPMLLQQIGYDRSWGRWQDSDSPLSDGDSDEESAGRDNPASNPYNLTEIRLRWSYARNVDAFDDEEDFFTPKVFNRATQWL